MEEMLLNISATRSQSETARRWLAMSIPAAPYDQHMAGRSRNENNETGLGNQASNQQ